uniref:Uncharacterized protein n=1 Tax=Periophthalmus magnuspinnatus TaxID=409849 RepID=A0A3B4A8J5_9GOBI
MPISILTTPIVFFDVVCLFMTVLYSQELQRLEQDNLSLQRDITALQKDKDFYTSLLETHVPHCCLTRKPTDIENSCEGLSAGLMTVSTNPVHQPVHQNVPTTIHQPVCATVHQIVPTTIHQPVSAPVHQIVPTTTHQPVPAPVHQPIPAPVHQTVPPTVHEPAPAHVLNCVYQTVHLSVPTTVPRTVQQPVPTTVHRSVTTSVHQPVPAPVPNRVFTNVQQLVPAPVSNTVCTNVSTCVPASVPSTAFTYGSTTICTPASNFVPTTVSPYSPTHLPITVFDSITTSVPTIVSTNVPVSAHVHTSVSFPTVCPLSTSSLGLNTYPEISYTTPVPVPPYPLFVSRQTHSSSPQTSCSVTDRSGCLVAPVTDSFTSLSPMYSGVLIPPVSPGPSPSLATDLILGPLDFPPFSDILDLALFNDTLQQLLDNNE